MLFRAQPVQQTVVIAICAPPQVDNAASAPSSPEQPQNVVERFVFEVRFIRRIVRSVRLSAHSHTYDTDRYYGGCHRLSRPRRAVSRVLASDSDGKLLAAVQPCW